MPRIACWFPKRMTLTCDLPFRTLCTLLAATTNLPSENLTYLYAEDSLTLNRKH